MEVDSASEDELKVVFRIDDSEFRRQLGELRREVEETGREGVGPARPGVPEPPIQVAVTVDAPDIAAVDGGVSEEKLRDLEERLDRIESGAGLTAPESRLTVAEVERRLRESLERYPVAQKLGLEQEDGEEKYTTMFQDLFSMLEILGNRQGRETWMTGWGSVSDVSGLRMINRLIAEVFPKDIVKKEQFGHIGTANVIVKRAREAISKGPIGPGGERVFHGAIQLGIQALSDLVKGGEVVTGTEVSLPGGGRLDVGMLTDDLIYMAEVKTGVADIGAIRQVRDYMEKFINQQFIQRTKWEQKEEGVGPDPKKEVVPWLREFLTQRREEGKPEKWLTSIVAAPEFTGPFDVQMKQVLALSTTVGVVQEMGALRTETVDIPEAAQMYMMRGLEALSPAERTKEANAQLWIEWLAGTEQYDTLITALNVMNIPQEQLNEYMAAARARFRENMTALEERFGRPLTQEEVAAGATELFVTEPMQRYDAARYNIREGFRTLVPLGVLPSGWEKEVSGRTAGIGRTIERGIEGITDWMLSDELIESVAGDIVGRPSPTDTEEFVRQQVRIWAEEGPPEILPEEQTDPQSVMRRVWRQMTGEPEEPTVVPPVEEVEEEEDLMSLVRRVATHREERGARGALEDLARGFRDTMDVEREREISLRDMVTDDITRGVPPIEAGIGGVLPVDIDIRQYITKLTKKARGMGLTLDEYRKRTALAESGHLMDDITMSYRAAVLGMKGRLVGEGRNEDLVNALRAVFRDQTDDVIEKIVGDQEIQADQWTEDLKKIYESVESGGTMASFAHRGMIPPLSALGQSIERMEDFEKYTVRLEPATGAFTIGGNCA